MIPQTKVKMDYIKVILFLSIKLIFAIKIIHSEHLNRPRLPNECLRYMQYINKSGNMPRYNLWHYTVDIAMTTTLNTHSDEVLIEICISLSNSSTLTLKIPSLSSFIIYFVEVWQTRNSEYIYIDYSFKGDDLIISFADIDFILPDHYTLRIGFKPKSTDNYFQSQFRDPDNRSLFMTQSTQKLFPSWEAILNHPKVTFNLDVWNDVGYTVLSNALVSIQNPELSEFKAISMMPENELVIVLLPTRHTTYSSEFFEVHHDPSFIIKTWCKTNAMSTLSFARSVINNVTLHLFQYTNGTYPYLKIDHVIIPDVPYKISKNSRRGIIIYRELAVTYNKETDLVDVKFYVMNRIISKIARQWIGGLVTPKISDSWISQSFAKFFQLYIFNQMLGKRYEMFLVMDFFGSSLIRDDGGTNMQLSLPPVLVEKVNYNKDTVYKKGALLLRMLQNIMEEKTFQRGVINLLNKDEYEFELVATDDLWSVMQTALNATSKQKVDIRTVMDTYVRRKGYPMVVVTRDYETGKTIISQQPYDTFHMLHDINVIDNHISGIESESNSSVWWIPVNWATESDPFFNDTTPTFWLGPEDKSIKLKINPDEWIIINLQQTGYYRVHYDRTNWEKIGNFLNNDNYTKIHVLNRAQLIYDICDMFQNGHIDSALFTHITSYLLREMDYIAWIPMLRCCLQSRDLNIYLNFPENKWLQIHLAGLFDGILSIIGNDLDFKKYNDDDDITKLAREELINKACHLGNSICRARYKLEKYLRDPPPYQLSWQSEYRMFCYGLKTTNAEIWHQVLQKLTRERKSLCPLACTEDSNIIMEFLHTIVENNTFIEKTDIPRLIHCIASNWIDNDKVFFYLLKEFVVKKNFHEDVFDRFLSVTHTEDQLHTIFIVITNIYILSATYSDDKFFQYKKKLEERKQKFRDVRKKFAYVR